MQAYCFRVCMTDDPELRVPWMKPEGYDPREYELARRWFNAAKDLHNDQLGGVADGVPKKFDILPNRTANGYHKTDTNNHGPVSSDYIGANWDWPTGSYARRESIFQAHVTYQKGYYWCMANDPGIPEHYRAAYSRWGLPLDEFPRTGHWPHQLYIREGRRMVSDYVVTEHDCQGRRACDDPVGKGSYQMDSHNCTRFVGPEGVMNDGDVQVPCQGSYPISYRGIVPRRGECGNLFVPVCISASHIAFGSARMEPVFMVLGESAAVAASLCMASRCASQDLDYSELRAELLRAGQSLT